MIATVLIILSFSPNRMPIKVKEMSTWLAFSMKNSHEISKFIPDDTELNPIRILSSDMAEPKLLFNMYESTSPFFKGLRLEVVTIVRKKNDPKSTHFVVLDCLSNTMSWDPIEGIHLPNAAASMHTIMGSHHIECMGDFAYLKMAANLGRPQHITKNFAVDANHLCLYRNSPNGIKLEFDEREVMKDVLLLNNVKFETNIWNAFRGRITHSFVHPHPMNFLAGMRVFK